MFSTKTETARLLIGVVVGLILLKLAVSWLTGSISIFLITLSIKSIAGYWLGSTGG